MTKHVKEEKEEEKLECGLKGTSAHYAIQCHKDLFHKVILCHWRRTMTKHVKDEKEEGRLEQSLNIQRGPRDFLDLSVSIDRSTHPHSFRRQAGCHASVGFPGRCQLLLHSIEQAKRVCPLQGSCMCDIHKVLQAKLSKPIHIEPSILCSVSDKS